MILGLSITTYTLLHTVLSLVGIVAGLVVAGALATGTRLDRWAAVFLVTTVLANASGFGFPFVKLLPSHIVGAVSLVVLAAVIVAVYRVEAPDGAVVSRLAVDGAEFWVADESPEHHNFSPESLGGGSVRMVLTVPDPDAMFAKALAAGAREVTAMQDAYGWHLGRVVDPFGHHWEIGRPNP